jgi:hypothetical protein
MNIHRILLLLCIAANHVAGDLQAQQPTPPPPPAPVLASDGIYRYDPFERNFIAVSTSEIKPRFLYYRPSPLLRRHVWSVADEQGRFVYAMAPGSVQYAQALDLRASFERQREELYRSAPELARSMEIRGGQALVALNDADRWELVQQSALPNVYDLETLRRWEWHGPRRVAVLHTFGDDWLLVKGKFIPASGPSSVLSSHATRLPMSSVCCVH